MAIGFTLNGGRQSVDVDPQMPLLWVLRDTLGMTGTKFGCGMALCGACTVHINGNATRACITPISMVAGKSVTTIEGLSPGTTHPVQQAWIEEDAVTAVRVLPVRAADDGGFAACENLAADGCGY